MVRLIAFTYNDHKIEIDVGRFFGKESIKYDGVVQSEKRSVVGTEHHFTVCEDNKEVTYIINIGSKNQHSCCPTVKVKRNGAIIIRGYNT
ncbi:MAG: hypothetical protein N0E42_12180 [Candidatus Thiodiazotropha endolucinida]|nr:hypothetical protein [Candidatus Thiodiazotropha taylori]MCW4225229.1 hypothetical protein [Candidatus Thiodiazotropha endolucinida]MCG7880781.1 hypothetical protein [Candidatus Thiodiazotropha taylori]MCG7886800.1 hypothetical protein [Candidatus Thiodiazotropha taylori]MCG8028187.1 hypothetical protein [Candidatus Thiodiazotropha taylori]